MTPELAHEVALQLTEKDALEAHARDEIGIHENTSANPLQAAGSSALAFSVGALFPMFSILLSPDQYISVSVMIVGILSLACLGALSSYVSRDTSAQRRYPGYCMGNRGDAVFQLDRFFIQCFSNAVGKP